MSAGKASTPHRLSTVLTVADIAAQRGVSRCTARRWLRRLDRRSGGKIILRDGDGRNSPIYTTVTALQQADPRWLEAKDADREELAKLREKNEELGKRLNLLRNRVRELHDDLERLMAVQQSAAK